MGIMAIIKSKLQSQTPSHGEKFECDINGDPVGLFRVMVRDGGWDAFASNFPWGSEPIGPMPRRCGEMYGHVSSTTLDGVKSEVESALRGHGWKVERWEMDTRLHGGRFEHIPTAVIVEIDI